MAANTQAAGGNWLEWSGMTVTDRFAWCGWHRVETFDKSPNYGLLSVVTDGAGGATCGFLQDAGGDGTANEIEGCWYNGGFTSGGVVIGATGAYRFLFGYCNGTSNATFDYWFGTETGSLTNVQLTTNFSANSLTVLYMGGAAGIQLCHQSLVGVRIWIGTTFNGTEVLAERDSADYRAVKTSGLYSECPCLTGTNPETARVGANATRNGTLTTQSTNPLLTFPATMTASATLAAGLVGNGAVASSPTASASLAAGLVGNAALTSAPAGSAALSATVVGEGGVAAAPAASATLSANLQQDLTATPTGSAALSATVVGDGALAISAGASASCAASLVGNGALACSAAASAALATTLVAFGDLASAPTGGATCSATFETDSLAVPCTAGASLAATLMADAALAAGLSASATLVARFVTDDTDAYYPSPDASTYVSDPGPLDYIIDPGDPDYLPDPEA